MAINNEQGAAAAPKQDPEERLRKELETPISQEDAAKAFADIDVERMKLLVVRQKWTAQMSQMQLRINALDEQLTALDLDRAVVFRRTLVPQPTGKVAESEPAAAGASA